MSNLILLTSFIATFFSFPCIFFVFCLLKTISYHLNKDAMNTNKWLVYTTISAVISLITLILIIFYLANYNII